MRTNLAYSKFDGKKLAEKQAISSAYETPKPVSHCIFAHSHLNGENALAEIQPAFKLSAQVAVARPSVVPRLITVCLSATLRDIRFYLWMPNTSAIHLS